MPSGASRLRRPIVLLLAATALGCGGRQDAGSGPQLRRLIEELPGSPFDVESVFRRTAVALWYPAADGESWREPGSRLVETTSAGLAAEPDAVGRATVWREVDADAALVDAVVVRTSTRPDRHVKLYWAPPDGTFTAERSLDATTTAETSDGTFESYFPVWQHAHWSGPVARIRLTIGIRSEGGDLRISRVEAIRFAVDAADLAEAASAPRLVELDRELRPALVARPAETVVWSTRVAPGDVLTFGFGLLDRTDGTTTFSVRAEGSGTGALFEARVGASEKHGTNRWHEARVAIEDLEGPVRLLLDCEPASGDAERPGIGFWSAPELSSPARTSRPNLLLVSLDTVRPDHLSLYGYERPTTPHLDRWAEGAAVFEQAVTTAPWTLPAQLSMLTGLDAFEHGVNHRSRVPEEIELLPETLRAAGYRTAAITGGGFLDPEYGLHQGFDSYRYYPRHTDAEELAHGLRAALDWLRSGPRRPWFLFFHTYEPHYPYYARQPFLERLNGGVPVPDPRDLAYVTTGLDMEHAFELTKQWRFRQRGEPRRELTAAELAGLVDLYDSGLAYSDEMLRRLLEAAEEAGDVAVAVTSDHGEALGERGLAGHAYLYDFNALVPLVLKRPGRREGRRIDTQVRITDLAPTFLDLAGLEAPARGSGRSLVPLVDGAREGDREAAVYASFANRGLALRFGRRAKYLFNNSAWDSLWGRQALYDLRADPGETRELAAGEADVEALTRRARALAEGVRGALRLSLSNHSPRPLRGTLAGSVLQAARLRSPRLPPGAVTWESTRSVALLLPADESFDLLFENPPGTRLRLTVEPDLRLDLDLEESGGAREWWLVDGGWSVGPVDGAEPVARVAVTWPRRGVPVGDPGEADAELREQLRALGYVE